MGPFPCAPHDRSPRWGMSIGPFACIHIEGQSSQNGGSGAPPNGHSGVRARRRNTCGAFTLASVFFARSARSPSIDRYKKQEELARPRSDVKISQARFPGERQRKNLPRTKPRERELLFFLSRPKRRFSRRTQDGTLTRSHTHPTRPLLSRPNGMSFMHFEIGKRAEEFQAAGSGVLFQSDVSYGFMIGSNLFRGQTVWTTCW